LVVGRRRPGLIHAAARFGTLVCFVALPAALTLAFALGAPAATFGWDFHAFWEAAGRVAHGHDPFAAASLNADGVPYPAYLYPPVLADLLLPLGLLPFHAAAIVFVALSAAAIVGALLLLGVRDARCYGVAFLWLPVLHSFRLGTLTPLLVLGVAACWRWRGGVALALVSVVKLFLWPLLIWSGPRAAVRTVAVAAAIVVASWATIGFEHLRDYPTILRDTQSTWLANGYGLGALGHLLRIPDTATSVLLFVVGLVLSALIVRHVHDDRESLSLFVVVALVCSPVGWQHYWALLLVPVALLQPALSLAWFVPLALWLTPMEESHGALWRIALGLLVAVGTFAAARWEGIVASGWNGSMLRTSEPVGLKAP